MTNKIPPYLPSLGRLLGFANRRATALSERELAHDGLTLAQWVVLTALWRVDGMTIGELASYTKSSYGVVSRTLDRMAARGLVRRESDPLDRRGVCIFLTGKSAGLAHLVDFHNQINTVLLKGFSRDEQQRFFGFLERVITNAAAELSEDQDP